MLCSILPARAIPTIVSSLLAVSCMFLSHTLFRVQRPHPKGREGQCRRIEVRTRLRSSSCDVRCGTPVSAGTDSIGRRRRADRTSHFQDAVWLSSSMDASGIDARTATRLIPRRTGTSGPTSSPRIRRGTAARQASLKTRDGVFYRLGVRVEGQSRRSGDRHRGGSG